MSVELSAGESSPPGARSCRPHLGGLRLPCQLTESLTEILLIFNADVLVAEENNTSLGHYTLSAKPLLLVCDKGRGTRRTEHRQISELGVIFQNLAKLQLGKFSADHGSDVELLLRVEAAGVGERAV